MELIDNMNIPNENKESWLWWHDCDSQVIIFEATAIPTVLGAVYVSFLVQSLQFKPPPKQYFCLTYSPEMELFGCPRDYKKKKYSEKNTPLGYI